MTSTAGVAERTEMRIYSAYIIGENVRGVRFLCDVAPGVVVRGRTKEQCRRNAERWLKDAKEEISNG